MLLKPSEIFYTQSSINSYFGWKTGHRRSKIGDTLDSICENNCKISDIPIILVCKKDGKWFTSCNRRLWIFRHLERLGKCTNVEVEETTEIPSGKMTSSNEGKEITVRNTPPGGCWYSKPTVYIPEHAESNGEVLEIMHTKETETSVDSLTFTEGSSAPDINTSNEVSIEDNAEGKMENRACNVIEMPLESEIHNTKTADSPLDDTEPDSIESDTEIIPGTKEPTSHNENADENDELCLYSAQILRKEKNKSVKRLQPQQKHV